MIDEIAIIYFIQQPKFDFQTNIKAIFKIKIYKNIRNMYKGMSCRIFLFLALLFLIAQTGIIEKQD